MEPLIYTVVRETWLSRRLSPAAVRTAWMTTFLMIVASLVFWGDSWHLAQWMSATPEQVIHQHQYWRAWTTLLVHADLRHLLSNSFLFFVLGTFLAGYFGSWVFPGLAFLFGGLMNLLVLAQMPMDVELVGVSGVVFWMGGFWLVLYFCLDIRKTSVARALRALGVGLVLFFPAEAFDRSISYQSHLYGFIFGLACGVLYFIWRRPRFERAIVREIIVEELETVHPAV